MKPSKKFNTLILTGAMATTALGGCNNRAQGQEPVKETAAAAAKTKFLPRDNCVVVHEFEFSNDTYDFRNGTLIVESTIWDSPRKFSASMLIEHLSEGGQKTAMDAFKTLPPGAGCKPPKFSQ